MRISGKQGSREGDKRRQLKMPAEVYRRLCEAMAKRGAEYSNILSYADCVNINKRSVLVLDARPDVNN